MSIARIALATVALACSLAHAEIEMVAEPNERNPVYHWWPKVQVPTGWVHAVADSYHLDVYGLAPRGVDFEKSDRVMYAKTLSKARETDVKTLAQFIARDHQKLRADAPQLVIKEVGSLATADGKRLRSFTLFPKYDGAYERVAYGEEGDFFVLFTLSAANRPAYEAALPAFAQLVKSYSGKPAQRKAADR